MRHAAFVRNIMIGREGMHRAVLLDLFERAGAGEPRSYISTGNVTFDAPARSVARITREVEAGIAAVLGRSEEVFVRMIDDLVDLVEADPFAASPSADPEHRLVSLAKDPVVWPNDVPRESKRGDWHVFAINGADVFAITRLIDGRLQDPGGRIQKIVGQRITTRAWSTIERIVADPS